MKALFNSVALNRTIIVGLAAIGIAAVATAGIVTWTRRGSPAPSNAGTVVRLGPAPPGDPLAVAFPIVREKQPGTCPAIHQAVRIFDGSIRAVCSDGTVIRIHTIRDTTQTVALRCVPPPDGSASLC